MMQHKAIFGVIFVRPEIGYDAFIIGFDFLSAPFHLISRCELGTVGMHHLGSKATRLGVMDKYTDHGVAQLTDLHILEMPDVPVRGTVIEIADLFGGGVEELKEATRQLQNLIYAA